MIAKIVMGIKNKEPIDWYSWSVKHITSLCEFYIQVGWCKRHQDRLRQFEEFQIAVTRVDNNRNRIIRGMINASPGLREHLLIHSVFDKDSLYKKDWLVQFMIRELQPTQEEIDRVHKKEVLPDWIMEQFAIFDPKPIGFLKYYDNVEISYKTTGEWKPGESRDPIVVKDRAWEGIGKKVSDEDLRKEISSYEVIEL